MAADTRIKWTEEIFYSFYLFKEGTKILRIPGTDVNWSLFDDFRACQTIDINHYTNVSNSFDRIYFYFKKANNTEVSIFVEDKDQHTRRPLVSTRDVYSGPFLAIENLSEPTNLKTVQKKDQ